LRSFNINDQELGLAEVRAHLSRRFSDLYALTPRRFEEVVGDVYKQSGYDVILTPTMRDGGADLICLEEGSGNQLIVECKRYAQSRKVGIGAVDRLLGVKIRTGSHSAHLVTSSDFTADARAAWGEARSQSIDLHLVDAHELLHLLKAYRDPAVRLADIELIFTDEQGRR
jgi:HJR/Mrr/RecB family endonuclease